MNDVFEQNGVDMQIPSLSPEQLEQARLAAAQARKARAQVKSDMRAGKITMLQALDMCLQDPILCHIKVVDLLKSLPRVGDKKASEIMERCNISMTRRVRGLGRHQLDLLRAEFC